MTLPDLLDALASADVRLGLRLTVSAPAGAVSPELRDALSSHKPALCRSLADRLASDAQWSALEPLRWGSPDRPEEPADVLSDEPPPRLPEGWTHDDYLAHLRSGGSPCP